MRSYDSRNSSNFFTKLVVGDVIPESGFISKRFLGDFQMIFFKNDSPELILLKSFSKVFFSKSF